ncbi:glycosyltransferase [Microbacterium sp. LjRoot45]|uniref:glycosyltransferase n=1 Tax=Microbacterium sp. LjRoot45 TaxID=3342329 RepID=UPI003ECD5F5B
MSSPRVAPSASFPLACWLAVMAPLTVWAWSLGTIAAIAFTVATSILWATGVRSAALWVRSVRQRARRAHAPHHDPAPLRVALLFCVADVDAAAVSVSMRQDVDVDTVILDDSRDPRSRSDIDRFARESGCRVVRRSNRTGFKAGNLNHALRVLRGSYDAYVVCDSDVVLPPGFVRVCAAELADPTVAVAQAAPVAALGRTAFARYFGPLLATHLAVTRRGRAGDGVSAFLGRGALLRAAALDDVGGVPEVVAEDLALTVALRRRGWRLVTRTSPSQRTSRSTTARSARNCARRRRVPWSSFGGPPCAGSPSGRRSTWWGRPPWSPVRHSPARPRSCRERHSPRAGPSPRCGPSCCRR